MNCVKALVRDGALALLYCMYILYCLNCMSLDALVFIWQTVGLRCTVCRFFTRNEVCEVEEQLNWWGITSETVEIRSVVVGSPCRRSLDKERVFHVVLEFGTDSLGEDCVWLS
jgi:hypothetical protein